MNILLRAICWYIFHAAIWFVLGGITASGWALYATLDRVTEERLQYRAALHAFLLDRERSYIKDPCGDYATGSFRGPRGERTVNCQGIVKRVYQPPAAPATP